MTYPIDRRSALKAALALGGGALLPGSARPARASTAHEPVPPKGAEWNESFEFPDEVTARLTRRLTSRRQFNQKPTYHINQGFTAGSRYLPICTWNEGGASALVRADVESGELKVIDRAAPGDQFQFKSGNSLAAIPGHSLVGYSQGGEIRLYDFDSGEMRVVREAQPGDSRAYGAPGGTVDGRSMIIPRNDFRYGPAEREASVIDPYSVAGVSFLRIDLETGEETEIFRDDGHRSNHVIPNPVDPDLVLVDRDEPPGYWYTNCGTRISRVWVLRVSTGEATEILPLSGCKFMVHSNWNYRGDHVYFHGTSALATPRWLAERYPGGYPPPYQGEPGRAHFVGVARIDGTVVWEQEYPRYYYGHAGSHTRADAIVFDNVISKDLLTAVYWRDLDEQGIPRIEIVGKHNSDYEHGQQSHPHLQMSPDGRWLSYNSGWGNRTDVYVLRT
jgi:hypothetical protein